MSIIIKLVRVTPAIAAEYLEQSEKNYRNISQKTVDMYARAMKNGEWLLTPQGMSFDTNDHLIDGQHRLRAVVQSGVTIEAYVATGVPKDREIAIDAGKVRRFDDHAKYLGMTYRHHYLAVAKVMEYGSDAHYPQMQPYEEIALVEKYMEPISFAARGQSRGYANAVVIAQIAKAYCYPEYKQCLNAFIDVLHTGKYASGGDEAAILLRNVIFIHKERDRKVLCKKTQSAIRAFYKREPYTKLYGHNTDLFPIKTDRAGHIVPAR